MKEEEQQPYRKPPASSKPAIGLNALSAYILHRLYLDYVNDVGEAIDIDYICHNYFTEPSRNLIKTAINKFRGSSYRKPNYISRSGTAASGYSYSITADGIEAVEKALRVENSLMRHVAREGEAALLDHYVVDAYARGSDSLDDADVDMPDDWVEVDLAADQESLDDAIDAVEKLIVEIRISNTFSAEYPEQANAVMETLESGVEKLRSGKTSRMHLFLLLQKPAAWIAERFLGTALGEIAKRAGSAVAKLLGF